MRRHGLILLLLSACNSSNGTPYGICSASESCNSATPHCVTFRNRINGLNSAMCTLSCQTSTDCPAYGASAHGVCISTETASLGSLCVQPCTQDSDCGGGAIGEFCVEVPTNQHGCVP